VAPWVAGSAADVATLVDDRSLLLGTMKLSLSPIVLSHNCSKPCLSFVASSIATSVHSESREEEEPKLPWLPAALTTVAALVEDGGLGRDRTESSLGLKRFLGGRELGEPARDNAQESSGVRFALVATKLACNCRSERL